AMACLGTGMLTSVPQTSLMLAAAGWAAEGSNDVRLSPHMFNGPTRPSSRLLSGLPGTLSLGRKGDCLTEWHLITGEYPPQPGGVSDYTRWVASGLASAGDNVHVWCPPCQTSSVDDSQVIVHRELGSMGLRDLLKVSRML